MGSLNLTSPCSLLPVHSLHCERTAHRTLLLRTLGPMGDQVLFHDLLSEAKDLRFLRIDDGPHPMRIRVAKGLYPREVLNGAAAGGAEQRFINAKNVRRLSNRNGEILVVKKLRGTLTRIGCHNFSQVLSPLTS